MTERTGDAGERLIDHPHVRQAAGWVGAALVGYAALQVLWPAPAGVIVNGVVIGGLTALIAFGVALVYRANGIVNFAQGDLGGAPAALGVLLIVGPGLPYALAMPIALVVGLTLGAVLEFVVIRRFFNAPRLILTVATLGLAQLLAAIEIVMPSWFDLSIPPQDYPSPFDFSFEISPIIFSGNDIIAMVVIPVTIVGLAAFFRFTDIGIAVRASAESAERASMLGVPVKRINTIVWALASLLATVAMLLRAGIVGLPIGSVLGPGMLLRALAAAVIGRMERLPTIFFAAIGLGIIEQSVVWDTGRGLLADPILFVVVLVALVLQRRSRVGRAADTGMTSWQAAAPVRAVPRQLRSLPEVRIGRAGGRLLVGAFLVTLPLFIGDASRVNLAAVIVIFGIAGVSLVLLSGWAGLVSLGQMGFVGVGAAVGGWLTAERGLDLVLALFLGGVVCALVATLIGIPALRIQGMFLAVTTLAFALAASSYFLNVEFFDWVPNYRIERTPLFGRYDVRSETRFYYLSLAALGLAVVSVQALRRGRTGKILIATRDNERGVQAYGINVTRVRLTAFALSGFWAGFAGALFVHHQQSFDLASYLPQASLQLFAMVVIGGLGSVGGALLGAAYIRGVAWFVPDLAFFASGIGMMVVLMVLPGGLGSLFDRGRDRFLRWVADRNGLLVPSLNADALEAEPIPEVSGGPERNDAEEVQEDGGQPTDRRAVSVVAGDE